ncbi:hypothetical protein F4677DRAFT_433143 [Hypoxylon crocopeplum]|nr:hypothetical protein F4677DRAFT_433143 [Hypoxylon crocopeplum]
MGQIHYSGVDQPLVFCFPCKRHFCFRHMVAWHHEHTCEEYDAFLADPQNFRSKAQIQKATDQARELENQRLQQQIEAAKARFAASLLRQEAAAEARRRALQEQLERENRLAEERAQAAEAKRKAQEALQHQLRLRNEEAATDSVFRKLTKPCPSCNRPIEKNLGW